MGNKVAAPVVIGASMMDVNYKVKKGVVRLNGGFFDSNIQTSPGGVAGNISESIYKLLGE